jgi:hypothetical protein
MTGIRNSSCAILSRMRRDDMYRSYRRSTCRGTCFRLVEYPRFSCSGGPFSLPTGEGIFSDILCIGNDDAIAFAKTVVAEVCEVFPAPFIHLGGDEIPLQAWRSCPKCQRRKLSLGLADERALYDGSAMRSLGMPGSSANR